MNLSEKGLEAAYLAFNETIKTGEDRVRSAITAYLQAAGSETVWTQLDIETVTLPRDFVERVVEIANRNEQSRSGDILAVMLSQMSSQSPSPPQEPRHD